MPRRRTKDMPEKKQDLEFEWDDVKASANRKKHEVTFDEASEVFAGAPRISEDVAHSRDEDRYIAIGLSGRGRHVYRQDRVRIFSARLATKAEKEAYGEGKA
jgi:hypothetical protein